MKKINLISLVLSLLVLGGCNKQDDLDMYAPDDSKRLKEVLMKRDGKLQKKIEFKYNDDQISEAIYYYMTNSGWKPDFKSVFVSEDDKLIHEYYYIKDDNISYRYKNIFRLLNNKVIEDTYFAGVDNSWLESVKWIYNYTGDKLLTNTAAELTEGVWYERGTSFYSYEGDQLTTHKYFEIINGVPRPLDKDTFIWENDRIVQFYDYNNYNGELLYNSKSDYFYDDDRIEQIDLYAFRGSRGWVLYRTTNYTYDDDGHLVAEKLSWGHERYYIYEKGEGNFNTFYYLPESRIFGRPMFKDANEQHIDDDEFRQEDFVLELVFNGKVF